MFGWKRRRRRRLREAPLPDAWRAIAEARVAHWHRLGEADRDELAGHLQVFLAEKRFEGCGGLAITDDVRVTIGAQACLLLLRRGGAYFPGLDSVLVYPSLYRAPRAPTGAVAAPGEEVRAGESWARGAVVLAWDRARRDAADAESGENVILHEFAHQIDAATGAADGAPALSGRGARRAYSRAFSEAFAAHRDAVASGRWTLLDAYAGESPAEFFACAAEVFFERPRAMCRYHPALYAHLAAYFCQEPACWPGWLDQDEVRGGGDPDFWTVSIERYGGARPIL